MKISQQWVWVLVLSALKHQRIDLKNVQLVSLMWTAIKLPFPVKRIHYFTAKCAGLHFKQTMN
jgi:hypothetical protein